MKLEGGVSVSPMIQAITEAMDDVPVQVGGGIRDQATIAAYLEAGISQTIVGTKAARSASKSTCFSRALRKGLKSSAPDG